MAMAAAALLALTLLMLEQVVVEAKQKPGKSWCVPASKERRDELWAEYKEWESANPDVGHEEKDERRRRIHRQLECSKENPEQQQGYVYSWGLGGPRMGRKGTVGTPGRVEGRLGEVKAVALAASGHTAAVGADGSFFTWGRNDSSGGGGGGSPPQKNSGQLGARQGKPGHATPVEGALMHERVTAAATGRYHTVSVTANGQVFAFGLNDFGQLGRADVPFSGHPHRVMGLPEGSKVVAVTCGRYHTIVVTADGEVFTWGLNYWELPESLMLESNRQRVPVLEGAQLQDAATPRRVLGGIAKKHVVAVDAGYVSWIAVTADGEVHTSDTGYTGYAMVNKKPGGDLGRPGDPLVPARVLGVLESKRLVGVATGRCHFFAVDDEGSLYSWGCQGGGGQLGRSGGRRLPGKVSGGVEGMHIVGACAGEYFSMAWSLDGRLFAWGSNGNDQLGVDPGNTRGKFPEPQEVKGIRGKVITAVAGYQHSAALMTE